MRSRFYVQGFRKKEAHFASRSGIPTEGLTLFLLATTFVVIACLTIAAQKNSAPDRSAATISTTGEDTRYRIGPGDVLNIVVRKAPELSGPVRVDQRGMIRIPMIDNDVQAACRTESELSSQIATLYLEFKKNPSVDVFVT